MRGRSVAVPKDKKKTWEIWRLNNFSKFLYLSQVYFFFGDQLHVLFWAALGHKITLRVCVSFYIFVL